MASMAVDDGDRTRSDAGKASRSRGLAMYGWGLYQHVAAVLAAFGLAAIVDELFSIGWRGFVGTLIGYWGEYVRPPVKWALSMAVSRPLEWIFGWHIEIPVLVIDYLSIGLICVLSTARMTRRWVERRRDWARAFIRPPRDPWVLWATWPPILLVAWPFGLVVWLLGLLVAAVENQREAVRDLGMVVAPLAYLALLIVVNYLFL
jgi:hypothetical protein